MAKTETIRLPLGGMWQNAHPLDIPDGYATRVSNFLFRPGPKLIKRPPWNDNSLSDCVGLALWQDRATGELRVVGFVENGANLDAYIKSASAETWTLAGAGNTLGFSVTSWVNYRDNLYYTLGQDDYGARSNPGPIMSFQGSAQTANALGGETLAARTIAAFVDRIVIGYVKSFATVNQLGTTDAYDPTTWSNTTTTTTTITNGSSVTGRITPTNTSGSKIYRPNKYTVAAATKDTNLVYRFDLRNQSPTYEMPMTGEIYYSQVWVADTAMAVGAIRVPTTAGGNGFRYRVTAVGGDTKTDASTEPTWPTTVGTTVVDDQVTWICDGPDTIGSTPTTLPTLTDDSSWISNWVKATIPPMPVSAGVGVRLKFGTTATSTIELAPVDFSFKDGLTDGAIGKANKGHQLTVGQFQHPFFNQQSSATATITLEGDLYWTETSDPNTIEGNNYWKLSEAPGPVTAMIAVGGRLLVFKERGMWVFQGSPDPENPLIKERFFREYGCITDAAVTVLHDKVYFSDRYGAYEYEGGGEPRRIDLAVADIIDDSTDVTWYYACADPANKDIYFGFGVDLDAVYSTRTGFWSLMQSSVSAGSKGTGFMVFAPDRDHLYFGVSTSGSGSPLAVHYMDANDTGIDGRDGAASADIAGVIQVPIKPPVPHSEISVDALGLHYYISPFGSATATTQTFRVRDANTGLALVAGGLTLETAATLGGSTRARAPIRCPGQELIAEFEHDGAGGGAGLTLFSLEADIRTIGRRRNMSSSTGDL